MLKSRSVFETAEQKFGKQRADELRADIEQLAADLEKLRAVPLDIEDAP
jgi:cell division protein FtsB